MLSIRSGTARDVSLIRVLIYEFAEYERLQALITENELLRDGFGTQPKFQILIAEWQNKPAGYALFFDCYSSFRGRGIFLEDLFVRTEFRGKKIGRALLARVAAIAQKNVCFGVMFNVLEWNRSAIEFYQSLGATFVDDWKTACLCGDAMRLVASEAA
jgi:GNAT superfamily N-acetyltransferase